MTNDLITKSHKLSRLLRHDTTYPFPKNGWRSVTDLTSNHHFTIQELEAIVSEDLKGRYEFSPDHQHVRARYGHTIPVNPDLETRTPPDVLYHGTAEHNIASILKTGISRQKRNYVHLSNTIDQASQVGARHGKPTVLAIDAKRMAEDGIVFYQARNGIWLTEFVEATYCRSLDFE